VRPNARENRLGFQPVRKMVTICAKSGFIRGIPVKLYGRLERGINSEIEIGRFPAAIYGGGNVGNVGSIATTNKDSGPELNLTVPPLAGLFLVPEA
jgi:hypothetical protein